MPYKDPVKQREAIRLAAERLRNRRSAEFKTRMKEEKQKIMDRARNHLENFACRFLVDKIMLTAEFHKLTLEQQRDAVLQLRWEMEKLIAKGLTDFGEAADVKITQGISDFKQEIEALTHIEQAVSQLPLKVTAK